ncbi:MAG: hypothetical protein KHZ77_06905 [Veillonella sp.]|uniref:hypothetical protein n=1 Tax=Veillonella sp. TaxID=1926307 RepID=UPI0025E8223F|nr:hypothetical protein [Veillonella sp.]MBS4913880.1 hypothetical protein [Veillonella sp.]
MEILKELKINPKYAGAALGLYVVLWFAALYGQSTASNRVQQAEEALRATEQQVLSERHVLGSEAYTLITEFPNRISAESLQQIVLNSSNAYAFDIVRLETINTASQNSKNRSSNYDSMDVAIELRGDLKEYLLFTDDLKRQYPLLEIKPQSVVKKNGQLHIICLLTG